MRARIRLFGSIDQNASDSWGDTCGWLISFQRAVQCRASICRGRTGKISSLLTKGPGPDLSPGPPRGRDQLQPRIVPALLTVIRVVPVRRSYSAQAQTNGGKIAPAFFGTGRYPPWALPPLTWAASTLAASFYSRKRKNRAQ
jgi:hypothetical protein